MTEVYDTYIDFGNDETRLNDETFNKLQDLIKKDIRENGGGGDSEEVGSVKLWFSNTIPQNWLLLNGQAVSRTEYSELFTILGTTYGEGNGSTTFNLPDMRGYVPAGLKSDDDTFNVLGKKVGEKKHMMTIAELVNHSHTVPLRSMQVQSGTGTWVTYYHGEGDITTTSAGSGQPFNIIQPSFVCNFIIKAKKERTVQTDLTLSEILQEIKKTQNISTYTSPAQFGLESYTSIAQICQAMPDNSKLILNRSGETFSDFTQLLFCVIEITKINSVRCKIQVDDSNVNSVQTYVTNWRSDVGLGEWKKVTE